MPTATFSLGKDVSVVVIAPNGQRLDLSIVTEFTARQTIQNVKIMPLNGPPQAYHLPSGWEGTITIDRANGIADRAFAEIERQFWAGGSFGTGTIYQFVTERDGSQAGFQYNNATMHLAETGDWKAESQVRQTVSFFASTRTAL
jgi:hypothetical protein